MSTKNCTTILMSESRFCFDENEDEPHESMNKLKKFIVNEEEEAEKEENNEIKLLRCTFNLSGFHSMLQPIVSLSKVQSAVRENCFCKPFKYLTFLALLNGKIMLIIFTILYFYIIFTIKLHLSNEVQVSNFVNTTTMKEFALPVSKKCHHNHNNEGKIDHFCDCGVKFNEIPIVSTTSQDNETEVVPLQNLLNNS